MSDSSIPSGINIISWIIGSGLIVFAANLVYNDIIKHPDINFGLYEEESRNGSELEVLLKIANSGGVPANDVTIAVSTTDLEIISYGVESYDEGKNNVSFVHEQKVDDKQKLIAKVPRLSYIGDGITIKTLLRSLYASNLQDTDNIKFDDALYDDSLYCASGYQDPVDLGCYDILVAYHEGADKAEYFINAKGIQTWEIREFPSYLEASLSPFSVIIVVLFLVIIAFLTPRIYNRIKIMKAETNRREFISKIKKEVLKVKNTLEKQPLSTDIFSHDTWNKASDKIKLESFDNYNYYRLLNRLYTKLIKRHFELLKSEPNDNTLSKHNEECLSLAKQALENIDWKKYQSIRQSRIWPRLKHSQWINVYDNR
jgi:hypothetical protein